MNATKQLRIVHIMRAPMGGVFRHVRDLAQRQKALGHVVTIICDVAGTAGYNEEGLSDLDRTHQIGVLRISMPRSVGLADVRAGRQVLGALKQIQADVVHGHGAKGGVYARAVGKLSAQGRDIVR
ncbi:MAG: glycosyltransferase, partial [Pseudomonadota bacterium]